MVLDNDTRGWIMTALSGMACIFGACFICIDVVVRLFPGKESFRVQDSDTFLGCSLSLSAGVMLFSALYSMLPSAKQSLEDGGNSPKAASWILIACFLGGVFGIQVFSKIVHRFMPSHAVDCDHTHDEDENRGSHTHHGHVDGTHDHGIKSDGMVVTEQTPLLSSAASTSSSARHEMVERRDSNGVVKPSLPARVTSTVAKMVSSKSHSCDADGKCYGYTHPCAPDCFKNVASRGGIRRSPTDLTRPLLRSLTTEPAGSSHATGDASHDATDGHVHVLPLTTDEAPSSASVHSHSPHDHTHNHGEAAIDDDVEAARQDSGAHHHHIPKNAFLSISLQTSVAIALHKLPEGFITYATNHANPTLGVAIFMAIAVHNITEGFALALPIFLASGSRLRAVLLSVLLGGLTQPLGAGIAAAWLRIAEQDRGAGAGRGISDGAYGGMFAVTAGIMASVALSLLQESFELSHARDKCMVFAFVGMGVLGMSSALTA